MQVDYSSWIGFLIVTHLVALLHVCCFHVYFPWTLWRCSMDCCAHGGAKDRTVLRAIRQMHREVQLLLLLLVVVVVVAVVVLQWIPRRKHTIPRFVCDSWLGYCNEDYSRPLNGNGWHHIQELQCKEVEFAEFEWACSMHLTSQGKGYRAPWYRRLKVGVQRIYDDSRGFICWAPKFETNCQPTSRYIVGFWSCSPCLKLTE